MTLMQMQARTSLMVDRPTFDRLAALARENERSASAEARVAIRRHLALEEVGDVVPQRRDEAAKRDESVREKAAA